MEIIKQTLLGKTPAELREMALRLEMPAFTGGQIVDWLYRKRAVSFEQMTNLSIKNRTALAKHCEIGLSAPENVWQSADGTKKYLFRTSSRHFIETVFIPDGDRTTLCVSSQIGCKMNCAFCATGKQGFSGQLSTAEILNQILSIPENQNLTNLVFMGMGEPFDNLQKVLRTIEIITADYGFAWSGKRITVSTIGVLPAIKTFMEQTSCHLAVSLHSPFSAERQQLMPIEKVFPLQKVLLELRKYDFAHQRRLSFEYIMFADFNDSLRHATELVKILRGLPCRVNLIRFHAIPNVALKTSNEETMLAFRDYLTKRGIFCSIRQSRGEDIFAACGMLSTMNNEQ